MKKLVVCVLLFCLGWGCWTLFRNNFYFASLLYSLPFLQQTIEIDLSDPNKDIEIPLNTKTLKLQRGSRVYVFQKEKILHRNKFSIEHSNYPAKTWGSVRGQPCPSDAYAASFYAFSGNVEPGSAHWIRHDSIQISVLPSDDTVRNKADHIRTGDQIRVSGIQFRFCQEFVNGQEQIYQKKYHDMIFSLRLFYVTGL